MKKHKRNTTRQSRNAAEALASASDSFAGAMHRHPVEGDRLFHWSYAYSELEFKNLMIKIMLHAGIREELIYIYDKTGILVNEQGYKKLSASDKAEIEVVAEEYERNYSLADRAYKLADYDAENFDEDDPLLSALYIIGNYIERHKRSNARITFKVFVINYLLTRAFRIIRAVFRSKKYSSSEELMVLIRSLYEIYCKIIFASISESNAQYLIDSDLGFSSGEYEILQKNGRPKRHLLIHKRSKKILPRYRSFYEYIAPSPFKADSELFSCLYEYLSSFTHSGTRRIFSSWVEQEGFSLINPHDEQLKIFAEIITCVISAMIMQLLLRFRNLSDVTRWDIKLFCYAIRKMSRELQAGDHPEVRSLLPKILARAASLPRKAPKPLHAPEGAK